jgi:hypothetical protein
MIVTAGENMKYNVSYDLFSTPKKISLPKPFFELSPENRDPDEAQV